MKKMTCVLLALSMMLYSHGVSAKGTEDNNYHSFVESEKETINIEDENRILSIIPYSASDSESSLRIYESILNSCTIEKVVGSVYVLNCRSIEVLDNIERVIEIVNNNHYLCIEYETISNEYVMLEFWDGHEVRRTIYIPETDTIYCIDDHAYKIIGFRGEINDTGQSMFVPESSEELLLLNRSSSYPQTDADLLTTLKSTAPEYTNTSLGTQSVYCNALNTNVTYRVTESRNAYTKTGGSWRIFNIGDALALAVFFLDIPDSLLLQVLSFLSISYSITTQTFTSIAKMTNSATVRYQGIRYGQAYDTLYYNNYMTMASHAAFGTYRFVYLTTGEWAWAVETVPSSFSISFSTIIYEASSAYETAAANFLHYGWFTDPLGPD